MRRMSGAAAGARRSSTWPGDLVLAQEKRGSPGSGMCGRKTGPRSHPGTPSGGVKIKRAHAPYLIQSPRIAQHRDRESHCAAGLLTLESTHANQQVGLADHVDPQNQPRTKKTTDITSPMLTMPVRNTGGGSRRAMRAPKYPPAVAATIITSACGHATRPPAA